MLSTLVFAAMTVAAPLGEGRGDSDQADSLRTLNLLLSSEFKGGNQVLHLENKELADSLIRSARQLDAFVSRIRDSSISRRIRSKAEFKDYWEKVEAEAGFPELRGQLAAQDVDKSRVPKRYLFDSSVVVYPGWIVLRRMRR